jgi:hypothetical protein
VELMDVEKMATPVRDRRPLEALLREWRAAERQLDGLDPDGTAHETALDRVEDAKRAYQEAADQRRSA